MAGGYHTFNSGQILTSAELDQYVRDQLVTQLATEAARDAAITVPVEGMMCSTADKDRIWMHNGAAWKRVGHYSSLGRTGFEVARAGSVQAIANSTQTVITFDTATVDQDAWHSGGTFTFLTVPTGLDGVYSISVLLGWSVAGITQETIWLSISGTDYMMSSTTGPGVASANRIWSASPVPLAAAQQFGIKVFQTSGGANNLNITLRGTFLGY